MNEQDASESARDGRLLLDAVTREFALHDPTLPSAFFPSHLPGALVDAVFATRRADWKGSNAASEAFCRHVGAPCERPDRWRIPERDTQYRVTEFVRDYRSLGTETLEPVVFPTQSRFPGAERSRAQLVLDIAEALRDADIEVLQDVRGRSREFVEEVLGQVAGPMSEFARWLLMLTGSDGFVLPDECVRKFVACATYRASIEATDAEALLRRCAHGMAVSPRYLDYQVYAAFGEGRR